MVGLCLANGKGMLVIFHFLMKNIFFIFHVIFSHFGIFSIKIFHLTGFEKFSIFFFLIFLFLCFSIFLQTRVQNWLKLTLTGEKTV